MLVSALIADGPPSRLIEEAVADRFELVLPTAVVEELGRVLERKLGLEADHLQAALEALLFIATARPTGPASVEAVTGDPDDDLILACAVGAEVNVIATGDRKHLLPVEEHRGVRILTPQALLAELHSPSSS